MMDSTESLVHQIVHDYPALRSVLDEHLHDLGGELLPYLFIADVERWAESTLFSDPSLVESVLAWLDRAYDLGDDAVRDWITAGFVEVLPVAGEPAAELRYKLGPVLDRVAEEFD